MARTSTAARTARARGREGPRNVHLDVLEASRCTKPMTVMGNVTFDVSRASRCTLRTTRPPEAPGPAPPPAPLALRRRAGDELLAELAQLPARPGIVRLRVRLGLALAVEVDAGHVLKRRVGDQAQRRLDALLERAHRGDPALDDHLRRHVRRRVQRGGGDARAVELVCQV